MSACPNYDMNVPILKVHDESQYILTYVGMSAFPYRYNRGKWQTLLCPCNDVDTSACQHVTIV